MTTLYLLYTLWVMGMGEGEGIIGDPPTLILRLFYPILFGGG